VGWVLSEMDRVEWHAGRPALAIIPLGTSTLQQFKRLYASGERIHAVGRPQNVNDVSLASCTSDVALLLLQLDACSWWNVIFNF